MALMSIGGKGSKSLRGSNMMSPQQVRKSLQMQGSVRNGGIFEPGWADTPRTPATYRQPAPRAVSSAGSFSGWGGTQNFGGGGNISMPAITFPKFQMPKFNIPTYKPPKAPAIKRLTYNQLLARISSDPGYLQEKAGFQQTLADALSAINAQEGLVKTDLDASMQKLNRAEGFSVTDLMEEMAGGGALRSSVTSDREGRLRSNFQEQRGDYQRAANQTLSGLAGQRSAARNQTAQNAATAKQNAIQRYLATRVNPTEVVY